MTRRHEAWTRHRSFDLATVLQTIRRMRWLRQYIDTTGRTVIVHYHGKPAIKLCPLSREEIEEATKILRKGTR